MTEKKFTEHELQISTELSALKEAVNGIHGKMVSVDLKLSEYCQRNEEQHKAMWGKIDSHSGFIKWIIGVGSGVGAILGIVLKLK